MARESGQKKTSPMALGEVMTAGEVFKSWGIWQTPKQPESRLFVRLLGRQMWSLAI